MLDRLDELRKARGLNQREFARAIGLHPSSITDFKKGRSKSFSQDTITRIIKEFGVNAHWLLTGEGPMFLDREPDADPPPRRLPYQKPPRPESWSMRLYGKIPASPPSGVDQEYTMVQVPDFPGLHDRCYLARVKGQSMQGMGIYDGDIVFVDTLKSARSGDIVVAFVDGEGTLKQLVRHKGRTLLRAHGRGMPDLDITEKQAAVDGVVIKLERMFLREDVLEDTVEKREAGEKK
ncbi:MAG: helix-turn-helix domain-containing protein [Spirochaetales bacterium]|nr:helix-turn-helix domain-containing protein [Spirochaetales bacterium]